MPHFRKLRTISVTSVSVSVTALIFWGVAVDAIWKPMGAPALGDDRAAAVTLSVAAVLLWAVQWLSGRGMIYLLDAMLTQRAWYRKRLGLTGPLPVQAVRRAR